MKRGVAVALLGGLLALAGCALPAAESGITIDSATDSNDGRPIAFDLVTPSDRATFQTLSRLNAAEYFGMRAQLEADFGKRLKIDQWQLAPGQHISAVRYRGSRHGAVLFASYGSAGAHRLILPHGPASGVISFGRDDFTWTPRP